MSHVWFNPDGLYQKFQRDAGLVTTGAVQVEATGGRTVIELVIDATTLTSVAGTVIFDNIVFPKEGWVEQVQTIVDVACSTASSPTFDLGLVQLDRTTEIDFNGFVAAAAATTLDEINETTTYNKVTGAGGALLGTDVAHPGYICANYNTAAFTTGKIRVKIFYRLDKNTPQGGVEG